MKTTQNRWRVFATTLLLLVSWTLAAQNQIPAAINYQGKLTDDQGDPLTNGYYVVEFRIWKDPSLTGASELAWGRSFPIHVVENGLFNVLLSNDGAELSDGGTGSLLGAFDGPDRYLGLTVVQTPSGTVAVPAEIKPRQRLVSAPYTIQAQSANLVAPDGVTSESLSTWSVTTTKIAPGNVTSGTLADGAFITSKIANSAVTTAKIDDGAVTTAKIADGAVTSDKLNINTNFNLNDNDILLQTGSSDHGLGWYGGSKTFGSVTTPDGPILYGWKGGMLGTLRPSSGSDPDPKPAMSWDYTSGLSLFGSIVDLSNDVNSNATITSPIYTANCDGLMMFYLRYGNAALQVWIDGGTKNIAPTNNPNPGMVFYGAGAGADGKSVMWPIKKGDRFQWLLFENNSGKTPNPVPNVLHFLPLGISQGSASIKKN